MVSRACLFAKGGELNAFQKGASKSGNRLFIGILYYDNNMMTWSDPTDLPPRTVGKDSLSGFGPMTLMKRPVRSRMRGVGVP